MTAALSPLQTARASPLTSRKVLVNTPELQIPRNNPSWPLGVSDSCWQPLACGALAQPRLPPRLHVLNFLGTGMFPFETHSDYPELSLHLKDL